MSRQIGAVAARKKLSFEKAKSILLEHGRPGDAWVRHSLKVAEVAGKIARALAAREPDARPEEIRVAALLHDIGRARSHGHEHGWEGYRILEALGVPHIGRFCISHWLRGRSAHRAVRQGANVRKELMESVRGKLQGRRMSLADKIVALADSVCDGDKVVSVQARYGELRSRYGRSQWLDDNERSAVRYMREIEKRSGRPLYDVIGLVAQGPRPPRRRD